jgi:uncharacterized protein (TIGR03437 family)
VIYFWTLALLALLAWTLPLAAADYATYIGDAYACTINALTVDSNGNAYITGSRAVVISAAGSSSNDVFVTKVDPSGNVTLLATLSGKGSDVGNGIAVDSSGNIYVAGYTTSPDFPIHGALQTTPSQGGSGAGTGFLTKLSGGGTILYSTYLGGATGSSSLNAVTVDSAGNAYVTGETFASDYPHTPGLPNAGASNAAGGLSAAFFDKISPNGDQLLYAGGIAASGHACGQGSSCFTSPLSTSGVSIALDPAGNAYIAGNTNGTGLPATAGAIETSGIGAFIFKVNAAGTGIGYLTLLGSANYAPPPVATSSAPGNRVNAIVADAAGDAYVTGWTSDPNFPATPGAYQSQPAFTVSPNNPFSAPPPDAFAAKINPSGTAMVWATFLGGSAADAGATIALDTSADVWITGTTQSANFPASAGFPGGNEFLVELNPAGTALGYASRFPSGSAQAGLAIDANGIAHIAGSTGLDSTVTPSSSSPRLFGVANAAGGSLAGRLAPAEAISIYGLHFGVVTPVSASFTSAGYLPTTLAGIQVTAGGVAAPLLYVSDTQINAIVPQDLALNSTAMLRVSNGAAALPGLRTVVDQAIPGVFLQPNGSAAALNQDGTVNSSSNPAPSGSLVSIWGTGVDYSSGADGQIAAAPQQGCSCSVYDDAQGKPIAPAYAGAAPGMPSGIVQVNFQVAAGSAPAVGYYLTANGKNGNVFAIYVAQ